MITDIFIKTYVKDYEWLQYCLLSIRLFAHGFRHVVIITDSNGPTIPSDFTWSDQCRVHHVDMQFLPHLISDEKQNGYLWQQCVKLDWWKWSDADAVFMIDSDAMLTKPTRPEDFYTNNKPHWFYRDWSKSDTAIQWKPIVSSFLQFEPPYEAMCINGFTFTREATMAFRRYLCSKYDVSEIWDIFRKRVASSASEFNMFGNFVYLYRDDYTKLVNVDVNLYHNITLSVGWSWGGLDTEKKRQRNSLLYDSAVNILAPHGTEYILGNTILGVKGDTHFTPWIQTVNRLDHDSNLLNQLLPYIPENGIVFDVGAYIGDHTCAYVRRAWRGQVHAFEPNPIAYSCLIRNVPHAVSNCLLLGSTNKFAQLRIVEGNFGASFVDLTNNTDEKHTQCQQITLDEYVHSRNIARLDFIKIDCEGSEVAILQGGRTSIVKYHPIMCIEVYPSGLERQGFTVNDLLQMIYDMGYTYKKLNGGPITSDYHHDPLYDILCVFDSKEVV